MYRQQFSYEALLKKVKGPGKTGFRMVLKVKELLTPVTTASVSFIPTGKTFFANKKGVIECGLEEDKYTYTLTAPGFAPVRDTVIITAGVMHRKEIILTARRRKWWRLRRNNGNGVGVRSAFNM